MTGQRKHFRLVLGVLIVSAAIGVGACGSDSGNEAAREGEQIGQQAQKQEPGGDETCTY